MKKQKKEGVSSKKNFSLTEKQVKQYSEIISKVREEVNKIVIGQKDVINSLIRALLCDGHVLLEGMPGIGKTVILRALAKSTGCMHNRVQFTVDLLPTDITGITTYTPKKGFETIKGPIFSNFVLADEINRAPPKTQSAMIEAMQEKQVTISKTSYKLPSPFFVMATQNPLEQEGVYNLPEAQIDRFLFKVLVNYPKREEERKIMDQNITLKMFDNFKIKSVTCPKEILKMQGIIKEVYLGEKIRDYILDILELSRSKKFEKGKYIKWGVSPRAAIGLFIASKAEAFIQGRDYVIPSDVRRVSYEVLRHRLILTYRARVENVSSDEIITEILKKIEVS